MTINIIAAAYERSKPTRVPGPGAPRHVQRLCGWLRGVFRAIGTSARSMYQRLVRRAGELPRARLVRRAGELPRARLVRELRSVGASLQLRPGAPADVADRIALLAEVAHPLAVTERSWLVRLYRVEQPRVGAVVEPAEGDLFEATHDEDEMPSRPLLGFSPLISGIPSRLRTRVVGASELERCYTPHHRWRCLGCGAALTLEDGDDRLGSGQAPRCDRCGSWTGPVHPDVVPARPS